MSDDPRRCERCGEPTPEHEAFAGACPRCMLQLGLDSSADHGDADVPWSSHSAKTGVAEHSLAIARYRILRVIGEGGMGAVYEAEQDHPRRTVALKIIKPGISNAKLLRRFEQESQTLGRLQHPGIAQIYEAGTADAGLGPQPYFAMELIRGTSLDEHVARGAMTADQRLEMVARIAEAVHHAHQRGVIHRDLKPGNIIVDQTGQPKVLDFGIARAMDSDTRTTSDTDLGQLVGTLNYMSPEQTLADPLEIDTRSDVYSLGVILYELLADRLPYASAKTLPDIVQAIRDQEPVRLGVVNRRYRGDIETIVATALEKDRTRRYESAAELAADIRRYLADQPIVARPPTAVYQLRKFARRNRALVGGVAAVFVVLLAAVVVSLWQAQLAKRDRDRAAAAEAAATAQTHAALEAERRATRERDRARDAETRVRQERDRALMAETTAQEERDRAMAAETEARLERDRTTAAEGAATAERNAAVVAEQRATREQNRALTAAEQAIESLNRNVWQNLAQESIRLAGAHTDDDLAALLARQAFVLSRSASNFTRRHLVEEALQQASRATPWGHSAPVPRSDYGFGAAVFSHDAALLATNGRDGSIEIWDLRRPGSAAKVLPGRPGLGHAFFAAFSPDGFRVATGGFESNGARGGAPVPAPVKIWDLREARPVPVLLRGHAREVVSGVFMPDGTHLVTTDTQTILLWDLQRPAAPPRVLQDAPQARPVTDSRFLGVSRDGARLATSGNDGIRLWDMRNPIRPASVLQGSEGAFSVEFSPDGSRLAASCLGGVRLWDLRRLAAPRLLIQLTRSSGGRVAFSPDGARLAASVGTAVYVWELANSSSIPLILRGHQGAALPVAFTPDGIRLRSAGMDHTVRTWELQSAGAPVVLVQGAANAFEGTAIRSLEFSSDDTRLSGKTPGGQLRTWSLRSSSGTPEPQRTSPSSGAGVLSDRLQTRATSVDGSLLAVGGIEVETVVLTDRMTGRQRSLPVRRTPGPTLVWFAPDGRLATINRLEVRIWGPDMAPIVIAQPPTNMDAGSIAISADGSRLAVGHQDVYVYNLRAPQTPAILLKGVPGRTVFSSLSFSSEGALLAGGHGTGVDLWDLRDPTAPSVSLTGLYVVASLAFSSDGHYLAMSTTVGGVYVWSLGAAAADHLCTRVWRNLSMDEWRLYVGDEIPYQRTCPGLAAGVGAG